MVLHGLVLLWSWFLLRCGESHWAKIAVFFTQIPPHPSPSLSPWGPPSPPSSQLPPPTPKIRTSRLQIHPPLHSYSTFSTPNLPFPTPKPIHPFLAILPFHLQPRICHFQPQNPSTLSQQLFLQPYIWHLYPQNPPTLSPTFHLRPRICHFQPQNPSTLSPALCFQSQTWHFQPQNPPTLSFLAPNLSFPTAKSIHPFLFDPEFDIYDPKIHPPFPCFAFLTPNLPYPTPEPTHPFFTVLPFYSQCSDLVFLAPKLLSPPNCTIPFSPGVHSNPTHIHAPRESPPYISLGIMH